MTHRSIPAGLVAAASPVPSSSYVAAAVAVAVAAERASVPVVVAA